MGECQVASAGKLPAQMAVPCVIDSDATKHGVQFLQIRRAQPHQTLCASEVSSEDDVNHSEDDPEALQPEQCAALEETVIVYDIVHSSSYQVPVLYLAVRRTASTKRLSSDELYRLLVPDAFRQQIEAVGVMGALSMTDHPVASVPVYFVHPCRTQEAMRSLLAGREVTAIEYLLLWLGLVGGSVGLNVPVRLMQAFEL